MKTTMKKLEEFFLDNDLQDPEDIDSLLVLADLARQMICEKRYSDISELILYTVENDYYEAFSWIMAILQEEFEKKEGFSLEDFYCDIGRSITDYTEFIDRLQVDFNVLENDVETVFDENGEVQSFFNIFKYKTTYNNIFLVSSENFDTKDNDFILYKLLFLRNIEENR